MLKSRRHPFLELPLAFTIKLCFNKLLSYSGTNMDILYRDDMRYLDLMESAMKDLDEMKSYWAKKYPNVIVNLWSNVDGSKFHGIMMCADHKVDLNADTLGELIAQGEMFLRKISK